MSAALARKGILLAGGRGTRLHPLTLAVSKQLLPVYDKPMIFYPLATLMLAGIREILIIATPEDIPRFRVLLGDGMQWGVQFTYAGQPSPDGIAQALVIADEFLAGAPSALVLGDNVFHGAGVGEQIARVSAAQAGACILAYHVSEPGRYGVVEFDQQLRPLSIEEKPSAPRSSYAIPGLYFFDHEAVEIARTLQRSPRGEYEITDVQREYLRRGTLKVELLSRGAAWLDMGTPESLYEAASYIRAIELRQGLKVASPEEIAWRKGWIDDQQLLALAGSYGNGSYGAWLRNLLRES